MKQNLRFVYKPISVIFICGSLLFCVGILREANLPFAYRIGGVFICTGLLLLGAAIFYKKDWWWPWLHGLLEQHTDHIDALSERHAGWWVLLASGLSLFGELLIIRWHASCFSLFAHFKNISLLSCFLGLGIGYTLGRKRPLTTPLFLPALAIQVISLQWLKSSKMQALLLNPVLERPAHGLPHFLTLDQGFIVYGFLIIVFLFNVLTFIPLGQLPSRLMLKKPPLVAYSWNLAGSLCGIAVLSSLSFAWSPPSIWVLLCSIGVLVFLSREMKLFIIAATAIAIALLSLSAPPAGNKIDIYSPYQIVSVFTTKGGSRTLLVNHMYHQRILDLSFEEQEKKRIKKNTAKYYQFPFQLKPEASLVLIVGSGTGNDVAAAIRSGSEHIDAVEIDPAILHLGKKLHPEMPYQNKRVRSILNDARSYIRRSQEKYDLIVYGLLDSHTMPSGMANTRLDSFVFTVEAFREALGKLKDDGIICMSFSLFSDRHGKKLFRMLKEAYNGTAPRAYRTYYDFAYTFVIGPGMKEALSNATIPFKEVTSRFDHGDQAISVSTDDWPFFYMPQKTYPVYYMIMVLIFIALSLLSIRNFVPGSGERLSAPCFFLGAGFMLIETKGITELGLNFGNTWVIISIVIAGILVMAFLANLTVLKVGVPPLPVTYGLVVGSLLVGFFFGQADLTQLGFGLAKTLRVFLLTLPLFFSGIAFSTELSRHVQIPAALSSNLMGAMLGGFLEYNAMYFGYKSLYLLAMGMYVLAFLTSSMGSGQKATG